MAMKNVTMAAVVAACLAFAGSARADNCADLKQIASKADKVFQGVCELAGAKIDCTKAKAAADKAREIAKRWDAIFKDSPASLGPRSFEFGRKEDGKLLAGTKRVFVSKYEASKNAEVKVTKEGGKAADITVCAIGADGKAQVLGQIKFGENEKGTKTKVFNANGRVVAVKLDAKKMNAFDYKLQVDETSKMGRPE